MKLDFLNRLTVTAGSFLLLPACVGLAVFLGRAWLTPAGAPASFVFAAFVALLALTGCLVALIPGTDRRLKVSVVAGFAVLWLAAWRPESRWPGALVGSLCLWSALRFGRNRIAFGVCIGAMSLMMALAGHERNYGLLDVASIHAVMQTHGSEALAFVWQELRVPLISNWLALGLLLTVLASRRIDQEQRAALATTALICAVVCLPFAARDTVAKARTIHTALNQLSEESQSSDNAGQLKFSTVVDDIDVVLVIGESSSRRLWQLFGAPVESTPRLLQRADRLILFDDVVSAHSHTAPAITAMMYRDIVANADAPLSPTGRVSLVDALRAGGVQVGWVSAQHQFGKWSLNIAHLARSSDRQVFTSRSAIDTRLTGALVASPDELATQETLQALARSNGGARLFVQHLEATHWPYCSHRLTGDSIVLSHFGPAWFGDAADRSEDLACYVRATRFVDKLLSDIVDAVQARARPTVMIFVPDHGEDPEAGTGHVSSMHSAPHIEIPMLMSFNEAAQKSKPEAFAALQAHRHTAFLNAWLFETVLDLFGLKTTALRSDVGPLTSSNFRPVERVLFEKEMRMSYDSRTPGDRKDALSWMRLNMAELRALTRQKTPLYAHRVDTIGKALDTKRHFDGLEMDIVFDADHQALFVYHPPTRNVGLQLRNQLIAVADQPHLRLWLDMKNLDARNASDVLTQLQSLDLEFGLRLRTIVEIPPNAEGGTLRNLASAGWHVSYYLPSALGECVAPGEGEEEKCKRLGEDSLRRARAVGARALSFDYTHRSAVQRFVLREIGEFQLLAWNLRLQANQQNVVEELQRLPKLDGLIIGAPSAYGR